ncbi:DMT family transporter [Nocardia sp. NPDC050175]|uniref:DMT family transporter n=1 Tax=Nocardia sp. NPDC050175 TaxID=3364317 RepID=UPI0037B86B75
MTGQRTGVPVQQIGAAEGTTGATIAIAVGALAVSTSGVLIALANAPTEVSTFYRCALALPALAVFAWLESRRSGVLDAREWGLALLCGAFFAADMFWWGAAILEAGAGLTTVLVNVQVVVVPLLALLIDREKPSRRVIFALPIMIVGLTAASGVFQQGSTGPAPVAGAVHAIAAGICYSGFLFLLRRSGRQGRNLQTYAVSIAVPAVAALAWALLRGFPSTLAIGGAALGWIALTALTNGVIGWLLVARYSPHVPSSVGAALLLLTPVGSLLLGALILGERPAPVQIIGCALILAVAYGASVIRKGSSAR